MCVCFFFQAEDGIRDLVRSRGLGDVYKRQVLLDVMLPGVRGFEILQRVRQEPRHTRAAVIMLLSLIHI